MLRTCWKIFGGGVISPSHFGTNQGRAGGQPYRQQVHMIDRLVIPSDIWPKITNVQYFGDRATLLTILSKLLEGSVPRVLIRHMPEVIDAITGWWADLRNIHDFQR